MFRSRRGPGYSGSVGGRAAPPLRFCAALRRPHRRRPRPSTARADRDRLSSRPSNFFFASVRLCFERGSSSPIFRAMRISSSCMFRSKTSSSRSAGTREGSRRSLAAVLFADLRALSLSRYSVRRSGSLSVRYASLSSAVSARLHSFSCSLARAKRSGCSLRLRR